MGELSGRVALVTGGGSGIGAATAKALVEAGARVAVADINPTTAEAVAAEIRAGGGEAIGVAFDVSKEDEVAEGVAQVVRELGGVDILHSNAAMVAPNVMGRDVNVHEMDLDVWESTQAVNVRGVMLGAKHVLPHMLERGAGVIINTASAAGFVASARPAYGASKAAVVGFTRNIATLYGKRGIRCVGIAPGLVITPAAHDNLFKGMEDNMLRHHLTQRLGEPEDIAHAVVFLASDRAGFITGVTLPVDGGFLAHAPTYADEADIIATRD